MYKPGLGLQYAHVCTCMYGHDRLVSGCIVQYDHALLVLHVMVHIECYDYNKSHVQSTFAGL